MTDIGFQKRNNFFHSVFQILSFNITVGNAKKQKVGNAHRKLLACRLRVSKQCKTARSILRNFLWYKKTDFTHKARFRLQILNYSATTFTRFLLSP